MKIIHSHPQGGSAEERRQQLLGIHNRCIVAVRGKETLQDKKYSKMLMKEA